MTLARLLAAALVICSSPAFAQDQQVPKGANWVFPFSFDAASTPSEPWRIIPNRADSDHGQDLLNPMRRDQYHFDQIKGDPRLRHFKLESLDRDADTTCYAIRSYVVVRDSNDSDSTHPAGYSTCQPAARYRLKTTEIRSGSQDR
jgi:hypothetical protein